MNWIIYVTLSVVKLLIVSGLVSLSLLVLPVVFLLLALGVTLNYLREIEPIMHRSKVALPKSINLDPAIIKSIWVCVYPQLIARFQHILASRNKTSY